VRVVPREGENHVVSDDTVCIQGIAAMIGCTREHVTKRVVRKAGFPRPVVELSRKTRRWDRAAVAAFLKPRAGGRPRAS